MKTIFRRCGVSVMGAGVVMSIQGCSLGEQLFALLVVLGLMSGGQSADLGLEMTASATTVNVAETMTYTLKVTNPSKVTARNVELSDSLPSNISLTSVTTSAGTCKGSSLITCDFGDLPEGAMVTVTIVGTVTALPNTLIVDDTAANNPTTCGAGLIRNTALVSSTTNDPNSGNNSAARNASLNAGYTTIGAAVSAASVGDTISVCAGSYTENVSITKGLTLEGAQAGSAGTRSVSSSAESTLTGSMVVGADNVVIDGFTINGTGASPYYAIHSTDHTNVTIQNNIIANVTSSCTTKNGCSPSGISIKSQTGNTSNVVIQDNKVTGISSTSAEMNSAKGIYVGDYKDGTGILSGLVIRRNTITSITANTADWPTGRGAYGILINHGSGTTYGSTSGASISDNTISNLEGLWAHAIGLEGNTPNVMVQNNDINSVIDHKGSTDAIAVFFEDNVSAGTAIVSGNNFSNVVIGVAQHPNLIASHDLIVDARNNWWGHSSGPSGGASDPSTTTVASGSGAAVGPDVRFDPWSTSAN